MTSTSSPRSPRSPRSRVPRLLALLVSTCLVAVGLGALASPPATAAPTISGRVIDATTGQPVAGFGVKLFKNNGGSVGALVDVATTNDDGYFVLSAPPKAGGYWINHVAGRYQAGWVGKDDTWRYFQDRFVNADPYASGAKLGKIYANPAFITGFVVDSVTNQRVAGVRVTARSANNLASVEASDVTDARGRFRLSGIDFEDDGALRFNGAPAGHETGYLACDFSVVGTWGDACASPLGVLSQKVRLDSVS